MQGDFSRNTFDPTKHFSRVLMQQGRVQLDADWNELNAIVFHYLRTLARDVYGPMRARIPGETRLRYYDLVANRRFPYQQRPPVCGRPVVRERRALG